MSKASEPMSLSNPEGIAMAWQMDSRFGVKNWGCIVPYYCPKCDAMGRLHEAKLVAVQTVNASVEAKYECGDTYITQGGMEGHVRGLMKGNDDGG